jgi:hypothetical protein
MNLNGEDCPCFSVRAWNQGRSWGTAVGPDNRSRELRHGLQTAWKMTKSVATCKRPAISQSRSGGRSDHPFGRMAAADEYDRGAQGREQQMESKQIESKSDRKPPKASVGWSVCTIGLCSAMSCLVGPTKVLVLFLVFLEGCKSKYNKF